jgi:predicted KAP-like P-loop ATPase
MFNSDQPIASASDDILGRTAFAKSLSKAILSYKDTASLSIGIMGAWGTGKTSLLNITLDDLAEQTQNLEKEKQPSIIRFNPWNFSDQNQLINQFFRELSSTLGRADHAGNAKAAGQQLKNYAKFFTPLRLIPALGEYAKLVQDVADGVGDAALSLADIKQQDLKGHREGLDQFLEKLQQKIIVVIDDIDRLTSTEIRQIFQLVKSLADFPNTLYLLSFDKTVVLKALEDVQAGNGEAYLEKIIQVSFDLPEITKHDVDKLLFHKLDEIISEVPELEFDSTYWGNIFHGGLTDLFQNIRDVNRFINTYRFNFGLVGRDLNLVELIAITALQVFEPGIYKTIRQEKEFLTQYDSGYGYGRQTTKEQKDVMLNQLVANAKRLPLEHAKELLQRLFPTLENIGYGYEFQKVWRRQARVCSPDLFDQYFQLSISENEFSRSELQFILSQLADKNAFARIYENLIESDRAPRFLERLEDYTGDQIDVQYIPTVLSVLFDYSDRLPEGRGGMFLSNNGVRVGRIVFQLLKRLPDQNQRFEIMKNAFESAPNGLYMFAREIVAFGQEHGKRSNGQSDPEEQRMVNAEQLAELEQLVLDRIQERASQGEIPINWQLPSLLYDWRAFDKEDEVKTYVQRLVGDTNNLIKFISTFDETVYSHGLGMVGLPDRVEIKRTRVGVKSISNFLDLVEIAQRLKVFATTTEYRQLELASKTVTQDFIHLVETGEWKKDFSNVD